MDFYKDIWERQTQIHQGPREQLDPEKSIQHNFLLYSFSYALR